MILMSVRKEHVIKTGVKDIRFGDGTEDYMYDLNRDSHPDLSDEQYNRMVKTIKKAGNYGTEFADIRELQIGKHLPNYESLIKLQNDTLKQILQQRAISPLEKVVSEQNLESIVSEGVEDNFDFAIMKPKDKLKARLELLYPDYADDLYKQISQTKPWTKLKSMKAEKDVDEFIKTFTG